MPCRSGGSVFSRVFQRARVTPTGIAVGVIATLVIGSGTAYAANGGTFRLGKSNKATKLTTLSNSKGTPLSLKAGRNKAPLKVNSRKRVVKLNADQVDGKSASAFALASGKTGVIVALGGDEDSPGPNYAYAVAVATCPKGTLLTGGGGITQYTGDYLWYTGPGQRPNTWEVDSNGDGVANNGKELLAYAVCYNPRGAVKGALTFPQLHAMATALRAGR